MTSTHPQFEVSLEGNVTIVHFKNGSFTACRGLETEDLHPHSDMICNCVDVIHTTTFRLKTVNARNVYDMTKHLFIRCEPSDGFDVQCHFSDGICIPTVYDDSFKCPGWKLIGQINFLFNTLPKVHLNLYKNRAKCIRREINKTIPAVLKLKPTLSENLSKLLIDETYSDVTVVSNDSVAIKAHRAILANRSEVFRAAIKHNLTSDTITSPLKEDVLRKILLYIYTDEIPKTGDFSADLFMAADYYHLLALKDVCVIAFYSQLTVQNAIATLELAEQHSLADLVKFTLGFIKNNFPLIVKTEDWDNIKSIELVKMISKFNAQL